MSASDSLQTSCTGSAIGDLYSDHHGWLFGWLRRRLGNGADAADLAHDTFVRLLVKPAARGFANGIEARGYLRTVAGGLCIDLWRRRDVEQAWLDTLAALPEPWEPSPEQRAIVVETLVQIGAMLGRLPQKACEAFVMAQIDGVRYREIAAHLGVSERMVKKYVAQGMLQCALIDAGLAPAA
ncbi:sigma-70 family RNA polymerase sigma factor [Paraburkholderia acidisoli]|uniref:Sigma-70 family RNA polymerase sigma factor n=1 Tax=Paraburkholderia acidisoli TaxID=2571748 RepID=A0A7Z2GNL8_9BURK|nr:sigma-70 family RNA polymerase sigma factor [Paraburkholderia acidisoli]QGZ65073.1 sigma-70 family RNA polymerase sigma factor [Paraburkholderia acidisoli]